jgi:hypothetical protein
MKESPVESSKGLKNTPIIPLMEPLKSTGIGDPAESRFGEHSLLQKDESVEFREEYTKPGRGRKHQGPISSTPKRRMPRLRKVSHIFAGRKNREIHKKGTIRAPATRSEGTDQIHSKSSSGSGKTSTTSGNAGGTYSRCVPFHDKISVTSVGNRKIHSGKCYPDDSKAIGSSLIPGMIQDDKSNSDSSVASDCSGESQPFEKAFDDLVSHVGSHLYVLKDLLDVLSEDGDKDDLDSYVGSYDPGGIASKDNLYFDTNAPQGISQTRSGLRSLRHPKKPFFIPRSLSSSRSFPLKISRSISRNRTIKKTVSFDVSALESVSRTQSASWSPRQLLRSMSMSAKRDQLSSQKDTLFRRQVWPDQGIQKTEMRIACDSKSGPIIASGSFNMAGLGISESRNPALDSSVSSTSTAGTHPWETALDDLLSHIEALNASKADSPGATRRSADESNAPKPESEEQCLTPKPPGVPKSSVAPLSASSEESKPSTLLPMFPAGSTTPKRLHKSKPPVTPLIMCLGGSITFDECKDASCYEHFETKPEKAGKAGTSLMCLDEHALCVIPLLGTIQEGAGQKATESSPSALNCFVGTQFRKGEEHGMGEDPVEAHQGTNWELPGMPKACLNCPKKREKESHADFQEAPSASRSARIVDSSVKKEVLRKHESFFNEVRNQNGAVVRASLYGVNRGKSIFDQPRYKRFKKIHGISVKLNHCLRRPGRRRRPRSCDSDKPRISPLTRNSNAVAVKKQVTSSSKLEPHNDEAKGKEQPAREPLVCTSKTLLVSIREKLNRHLESESSTKSDTPQRQKDKAPADKSKKKETWSCTKRVDEQKYDDAEATQEVVQSSSTPPLSACENIRGGRPNNLGKDEDKSQAKSFSKQSSRMEHKPSISKKTEDHPREKATLYDELENILLGTCTSPGVGYKPHTESGSDDNCSDDGSDVPEKMEYVFLDEPKTTKPENSSILAQLHFAQSGGMTGDESFKAKSYTAGKRSQYHRSNPPKAVVESKDAKSRTSGMLPKKETKRDVSIVTHQSSDHPLVRAKSQGSNSGSEASTVVEDWISTNSENGSNDNYVPLSCKWIGPSAPVEGLTIKDANKREDKNRVENNLRDLSKLRRKTSGSRKKDNQHAKANNSAVKDLALPALETESRVMSSWNLDTKIEGETFDFSSAKFDTDLKILAWIHIAPQE